MNYEEQDYEEIFTEVLEDSVNVGLISKADNFLSLVENRQDISNYYIMDKSAISKMFERFYERATLIYNSNNLALATGIDLDNFGDEKGIPRPPATAASVEVTFTFNEGEMPGDITLPEGIIVSTEDGDIQYETIEPLYIPVDGLSATVPCLSVETGTQVRVIENTLTTIVSNLSYRFICTNQNASSGGTDEYNDYEYRELLYKWREILIKGTNEAYEEYFANFDGIDGYKLVPNWNGTGTMRVILDPGTPYLLNAAYDDLQNIVSQANEDITMFAPTNKAIDIYAVVNIDIDQINPYSELEKEDIKSKIESSIKVFIDGGYRNDETWTNGLNIGEDFIPHKLAVFLDEEIPELKSIQFKYPEDYIKILDDEIGISNTITIEMV